MRVALLQMCSKRKPEHNIPALEQAAEQAKQQGADALFLPEIANFSERGRDRVLAQARRCAGDPFLIRAEALATEHDLPLFVGSAIVTDDSGPTDRVFNRAHVFTAEGCIKTYDKIHLYDADPEGIRPIRESDTFAAGDRAEIVTIGSTVFGLSICYDIRFPQLYRALAKAGAEVLVIPAAFTVPTGTAHWHALLRTRAIENGAFVIAAAQGGIHEDGRETFGHSLVVDPWGKILLDAGNDRVGLSLCDLDFDRIAQARHMIRSLQHDRPFAAPILNIPDAE